jgi:hypothetical protein
VEGMLSWVLLFTNRKYSNKVLLIASWICSLASVKSDCKRLSCYTRFINCSGATFLYLTTSLHRYSKLTQGRDSHWSNVC